MVDLDADGVGEWRWVAINDLKFQLLEGQPPTINFNGLR
jgi:hypothetical protein